ncbi:MAG: helix-turn-helix domain-containing protein [Nanoarchaeota archaeon]
MQQEKTTSEKVYFPTYIFRDRSVAVLEAMVAYLLEKGMTYREIGQLLNRNERTIWTTSKRVKQKRHERR